MAMVDVDVSSLLADSQAKLVSLVLSLHSSNEPGELSQWPRHDDSTINIVFGILTITATN